jgi:membrane fusion protein, multidrug efflux system
MTFETARRGKDVPPPAQDEVPNLRAIAPSRGRTEALSPEPAEPPAASKPADAGPQRFGLLRRHPAVAWASLAMLILVAGLGYLYWDYIGHFESTDDAFIAARQFSIAPKVAGYITAVPVTDNQHVNAGDVIARIDDRDFRVALQQADAQVGVAAANIQNIDAQIDVQQSQIAAAQAQVEQAQAALVFAQQQAKRFEDLAKTGYGTVQNEQQFNSQLHQQQSALASAQSSLNVVQRQIASLRAQRKSAEATLAQTQAQRDQARLNLSYTTVTADQPGRVVQLSAATGEFAQAGTALTMFVPDEIWVAANFKETQLDAMRPGQAATIAIDAYPDRPITGEVASVQPGSGTAFSLLPAENATGNFVKIVQRVPVKIIMRNAPTDVSLGPGMSVVPTVRVDPTPSLYERLTALL